MKIAVIGAGAMGSYIARDLAHNETGVQITIIDSDPRRASKLASSLGDGGHDFKACDALQSEALAAALSGTSVAINAAQYDVNTSVMQACLRAGNHYLDLGGMFHMTRRQLEWSEQFRTAGLTAILGMGAAPGITNVLASEACSLLDTASWIEASFAASAPDAPTPPAFIPPYSIRTIMQEFCDESVQYIEGEHRVQKPLAGRKRITFPDPIGAVDCVYTLHSEPATLPDAFRAKGVREVCWRLGLPPALEMSSTHLPPRASAAHRRSTWAARPSPRSTSWPRASRETRRSHNVKSMNSRSTAASAWKFRVPATRSRR